MQTFLALPTLGAADALGHDTMLAAAGSEAVRPSAPGWKERGSSFHGNGASTGAERVEG